MSRVYLAGAMTGKPWHNYKAFFDAEEILMSEGYEVVNPARNQGGNDFLEAYAAHECDPRSWEWFLRKDLASMLTCDAVFTLPGWEGSRGANLEVYVAREVGMTVVYDHDLLKGCYV